MAERCRFITALMPRELLEKDELARFDLVLPPNADSVRLHLVDADAYVLQQIETHVACLGALTLSRVTVLAKRSGQRVIGGVSFLATAEDLATSPREFSEMKAKGAP